MTLKQSKKILKDWFENHLQINQTLFCNNEDLRSRRNLTYPVASLEFDGSRADGDLSTHTYKIVLADLMDVENRESVFEIQDAMTQIANDLLADFGDNDDFDINANISIEPFEDDFTDRCAGVVFFINIVSFREQNTCAIPVR